MISAFPGLSPVTLMHTIVTWISKLSLVIELGMKIRIIWAIWVPIFLSIQSRCWRPVMLLRVGQKKLNLACAYEREGHACPAVPPPPGIHLDACGCGVQLLAATAHCRGGKRPKDGDGIGISIAAGTGVVAFQGELPRSAVGQRSGGHSGGRNQQHPVAAAAIGWSPFASSPRKLGQSSSTGISAKRGAGHRGHDEPDLIRDGRALPLRPRQRPQAPGRHLRHRRDQGRHRPAARSGRAGPSRGYRWRRPGSAGRGRQGQRRGRSRRKRGGHEPMIKADRKITSLKQLQGHIWRTGFESQEIKGVVFDDVPPALEKWHASGIKTYIYSSGSREAQRLIFGNTTYGDLRKHLCGFFDTKIGTKREACSYYEIWQTVGVDRPSQILFLTDVYQEATAAQAAGLEVLLSIRPGNAPLPENHGFGTVI